MCRGVEAASRPCVEPASSLTSRTSRPGLRAAGSLAVAALHVFALVADPGWAPVAAGGVGPLAPSRGRRILVTKPMPHCARIALMEAELGAEKSDEVGARPVDGVPLEPQVAPLRERHVEGGHQHEVL